MKKYLLSIIAVCVAAIAMQGADYSGTLPVMYINTKDNAPINSKTEYVAASYYIDNMGLEQFQSVATMDKPDSLQIRGRGNWTWNGFDKKPYRIKLNKKTDLLGLGKNKHFALLAHADDSYGFLRNPMGFYLSKELGMPWTPGEQPLEVVLNGNYIGLYFLTETIRVDADRVNVIEQPNNATNPEEITGGWLVEIDNYDTDPHITITEGDGARIIFTYKSPDALSSEQKQYLTDQMSLINSEVYDSDKTKCKWAQSVDLETLAKFYIVQEIMDNYESFHGSCYLNKQRGDDEKWMFGPVWDFGSAFNYTKSQYTYQGREHHMTWIGEMCKFPAFMEVVKTLWKQFYETKYFDMLDYAQVYGENIAAAALADSKRWPKYGNADELAKVQLVKKRLRSSCNWLASQWGGTPQDADLAPITIYYVNTGASKPWTDVYAYSWTDGPDGWYELYGSWPGMKMDKTIVNGEEGFAITILPVKEMGDNPGLVLNNGKGSQTQDLILYNGAVYQQDGSHTWMGAESPIADSVIITRLSNGVELQSDTQQSIQIVTLDGYVRTIETGQNKVFVPLPKGFYIIGGHKIVI